jgi:hypothetical protein
VRSVSLTLILMVALGACGDGDGTGERTEVQRRGEELQEVPLRPNEAPDGLEEDARGTGPIAGLRDVIPPRRTAPGLPPVPRDLLRSFEAGYERLYRAARRSAASSALRFEDSAAATRFLRLLQEVHTASYGPSLSAAVGEEGYGWTHVVPGAESSGAVWRRGELVLTVSISGPMGQADAGAALELARRVDGRLG